MEELANIKTKHFFLTVLGVLRAPNSQWSSLKERPAGDRQVRKFVLWPENMCRLSLEP